MSAPEIGRGTPSPRVLELCRRPRNAGSLDPGDPRVGTGLAGAPEGGDLIRIQVRVDEEGVIQEARFKAFGCGSSIASASLATQWATGRTPEEALRIRNTDIAGELELPPSKVHCSLLAEEALRAAIGDYRERRRSESGKNAATSYPTGAR